MAGDWIKVQTSLHENPKLSVLAEELCVHEMHALGLLVRFWSWADSQLLDCNAPSVTEKFIDRIVGHAGFAAALRKVGWLSGEYPNLVLPNFDEHNGQTAKQRALTYRRVQKTRHKSNAATVTPVTPPPLSSALSREEKRREEYIPPVVPPSGGTSEPEGEALPQPPVVVSESMARGWFESMVQAGAPFTPDEFAEAFRLLHSTRDVRTGAWLLGRRGLVSDPRTALEQRLHDTHARRESRAASNQPTGAPSQAQSAFVLRQRIAAMEQNLAAHKGNPQGGYPPAVQEAHHADWRSKNRALNDLRHQLANLNDPTHEPVAA